MSEEKTAATVWTPETIRLLIRLYNQKVPMKEIAAQIGVTPSNCHSHLSKLRLKNMVGYQLPQSSCRVNPKTNRGTKEGDEARNNFDYVKFRRHAEEASNALLKALVTTYGEIGSCSRVTRSLPSSALPTNQRPVSDTVSAG